MEASGRQACKGRPMVRQWTRFDSKRNYEVVCTEKKEGLNPGFSISAG